MQVPVEKDKKLLSIEFPGIVDDVDKAVRCLGGIETIEKVYADETKRLICNFRPNCFYSRPVNGDRSPSTKLLLRVRRRKKKSVEKVQSSGTASSNTEATEYEHEAHVLGIIDEVYKFETMMDSQYLPVITTPDGTVRSLRKEIIIDKIERKEWLNKDVPLFVPPPIFSRIDRPIEYAYRDAHGHRAGHTDPSCERDPHLIGASRQRRPHYTKFASFEDPTPTKPMKEALEKFKNKVTDFKQIEKLRQLFQERPIWSKNALKANLQMNPDHYKVVLPTLAYFFTTGPWRSLWVRMGYDPRKDPSSKKYQLVDFRVRQKSAVDILGITTKRTTYKYHLPTSVVKSGAKASVIKHETFNVDWSKEKVDPQARLAAVEGTYIFRPGLVPAYRQMFYQLLDIEEPEVQAIMHENDGQETECTERDGWCVENYQEKCREVIAGYVKEILSKSRPAYFALPKTKPKEKGRGKTFSYTEESSTSNATPSAVEDTAEKYTEQQSAGEQDDDEEDDEADEDMNEEDINEMEIEMLDLLNPMDDLNE